MILTLLRRCIFVGSILLALLPPATGQGQSIAEAARAASAKRTLSKRKVWTNDDFRRPFPAIKLLGEPGEREVLSPYAPTPFTVVRQMLQMANVFPGETVFDVGSGDGRIVIMAAERFGARGVGIELDEKLVAQSRRAVEAKGLQDEVRILHANALDVDLSPADVVTLYLIPEGIQKLRPHLERTLRPGTRVVSHRYPITGWEEEGSFKTELWYLYFYVVR